MKKTKKQKIKTFPFSEFKKKLLKDPEVKKAYDNLEFEYKIIGALIEARSEKKMTQKQLADRIGVAQSALARFESGRVDPGLNFIKKVTIGLGLKLVVR